MYVCGADVCQLFVCCRTKSRHLLYDYRDRQFWDRSVLLLQQVHITPICTERTRITIIQHWRPIWRLENFKLAHCLPVCVCTAEDIDFHCCSVNTRMYPIGCWHSSFDGSFCHRHTLLLMTHYAGVWLCSLSSLCMHTMIVTLWSKMTLDWWPPTRAIQPFLPLSPSMHSIHWAI